MMIFMICLDAWRRFSTRNHWIDQEKHGIASNSCDSECGVEVRSPVLSRDPQLCLTPLIAAVESEGSCFSPLL